MSKSYAINREVIVKFFSNYNPNSDNTIITRTLGKMGMIDIVNQYPVMPQDKELWRVRILKETIPGKNLGCFILAPISKIQDYHHVMPGMYREVNCKGLLLIKPDQKDINWILALTHKQSIMHRRDIHAVVVDLSDIPLPDQQL